MIVKSISLKNFRNLSETTVELSKNINVFYGDNAQGKTNFLESIYLCATGRSPRTHLDREFIRFSETESYIQMFVDDNEIIDKISMHIKKDAKKGIAVNGIPIRKLGDLFGKLLVVIFSPEDLQIVKAGPSERRKFIDTEACQLSRIYYYELISYYKILKQRNNLLKNIQKDKTLQDTLFVWDEQLISHGSKIIELRANFLHKISEISQKIYTEITDNKEVFELFYKPNTQIDDFRQKLTKNIERDIFLGTTTVGIHKDDIFMTIGGVDVRSFASQGQQRSVALALKLSEIELMKEITGKTPVLLLDDVFSELDEHRQRFLINFLNDIQTIITCTGIEDIMAKNWLNTDDVRIFKVESGLICPKESS